MNKIINPAWTVEGAGLIHCQFYLKCTHKFHDLKINSFILNSRTEIIKMQATSTNSEIFAVLFFKIVYSLSFYFGCLKFSFWKKWVIILKNWTRGWKYIQNNMWFDLWKGTPTLEILFSSWYDCFWEYESQCSKRKWFFLKTG